MVAFGSEIVVFFASGVGWRKIEHWWDRLDGGSRALLTVSAVAGLILIRVDTGWTQPSSGLGFTPLPPDGMRTALGDARSAIENFCSFRRLA
jgi:hypothetical protein